MGINFYESENFQLSYKIFPVLGKMGKVLICNEIISLPGF